MKKILINILFIIFSFCMQNCIFPQLPFLAAAPNLLIIIIFSFGFIYGSGAGMLYGLLAGILMDLSYPGPFGFYSLIFILIGYLNGIFTRYYYDDYIILPLILCSVNDIAYNIYIYIFRFLVRNKLDFFYYFRKIMIPEVIFTVVVTLLLYRLVLYTTRKIDDIGKERGARIV